MHDRLERLRRKPAAADDPEDRADLAAAIVALEETLGSAANSLTIDRDHIYTQLATTDTRNVLHFAAVRGPRRRSSSAQPAAASARPTWGKAFPLHGIVA